jgi:hypothetical protein
MSCRLTRHRDIQARIGRLLTSVYGTVRQFAALQRRVRSWGQTSRHRRDSVTGEDDPNRSCSILTILLFGHVDRKA